MENRIQIKNRRGQTLLETIAVLVVIGLLLSAIIPAVTGGTDKGRVGSALSTIRSIQSAAVGFYNDNNGSYSGISITALSPKYLPSANSVDPWGGTTSIAVNGTTTNQYVVTMSNVPSTAADGATSPLQTALQNTAISESYDATTDTFTATLA